MVELGNRSFGADLIGPRLLVAGATLEFGQPRIDFLEEFVSDIPDPSLEEKGRDYYFSVPENCAFIKRIKLPAGESLDTAQVIRFELAATLPGNSDRYYFESCPLDSRREHLAVACPKDLIDETVAVMDNFWSSPPRGFRLRGLALASAYRHFCRQEGGELAVLIDIHGDFCSYCFIEKGLPVALGAAGMYEVGNDSKSTRPFLLDLAAALRYHQAALFTAGHTAPLSLITVSGSSADRELAAMVEEIMHLKAVLPSFRSDRIAPENLKKASAFMVGIGLTLGK